VGSPRREWDRPGSTATALRAVDFVTNTRTDADATNDIAVATTSLGFFSAHIGDDGNCGLTNHDDLHLAICNSVEQPFREPRHRATWRRSVETRSG
jgi:hypothetical protein